MAKHAISYIQIGPAVVVQVTKFDSPSPVGAVDAGEISDFHKALGVSVKKQGIAHVLSGLGDAQEPAAASHVAHSYLLLQMIRRRHIGCQQIEATVSIDISRIGSHRKPGRVGQHFQRHVLKAAITQIPVESVFSVVIIADVKIGPQVAVVVEPQGIVTEFVAFDPGLLRDVRKPLAVVAEQQILLTRANLCPLSLTVFVDVIVDALVFADFLRDPARLLQMLIDCQLEFSAGGSPIGQQVHVQVAIAVVIAKGGHDACTHVVQAKLLRLLVEPAIPAVDVEEVWCIVATHIQIHVTVIVDISETCAGIPCLRITSHAGFVRDVFEFKRSRLLKQTAASCLAADEEIR